MSNFSMDHINRAVDSARNSGLGDFLFQEPFGNRGRSNRGGCNECVPTPYDSQSKTCED